MVKKTVKLVAQERFDIIDALALQQGTLDYVTNALGNIMGHSNGLLTDLVFSVDSANQNIDFITKFAFFVTTASATGGSTGGEVVIYDPDNTSQSTQSISFSSIKTAAIAYFAGSDVDAEGNDATAGSYGNLPTLGAHAPFLWARPFSVDGDSQARRKWSVGNQTETPVTIPTRRITTVQFAFSSTMPSVAAGESGWAPIAKVVQWAATSGVPVSPKLVSISAFDNDKWASRADVPSLDTEPSQSGVQGDFYNSGNLNINTMRVMSGYGGSTASSDKPAVPFIYDVVHKLKTLLLPNAASSNSTASTRFADLNTRIEAGDSLTSLFVLDRTTPASTQPWKKATTNSSNGIVDQLNAIRVVLQNLLGDGVYDYNTAESLDNDLAAPFQEGNRDSRFDTVWATLGKFKAHWSAKPLRSVNALSVENILQSAELERLSGIATKNAVDLAILAGRVFTLEGEGDGFSSVPITDAQPLVPALAMSFKANYGPNTAMRWYGGPADSVRYAHFFMHANMYSQITYAYGGVNIGLSEEALTSLGGVAALTSGQCIIQATPLHYENSESWLYPRGKYAIGKVDDQAVHEGGSSGTQYQAEDVIKQDGNQVLRAFANFYRCTLNVMVRDGGEVCIYPVTTVPDIVDEGADLRGYPAFGGWIGRVSGHSDEVGTGTDVEAQTPESNTSTTPAGYDGKISRALHGDVTDPDIFRNKSGGYDVSERDQFVGAGLFHPEVFGASDDLRGFAQSITFIRPDRFWYGAGEVANTNNIGNPPYTAAHNAPSTHIVDAGDSNVSLENHGDASIKAQGANGRFMPSFSLVIYKNTFTGMGTDLGDTKVTDSIHSGSTRNGVSTFSVNYNEANVKDTSGTVQTSGDITTRVGS